MEERKAAQILKKILRPPNEGLLSYHPLAHKLSNPLEQNEVKKYKKNLFLLSIPFDGGAGILRGSNWGPKVLREILFDQIGAEIIDLGDVPVIPHLLQDSLLNQETILNCQNALYGVLGHSNWPVSPLSIAEYVIHNFYKAYSFPLLTLGGDHSISFATIKPWLERNKKRKAILQFDAHTDLLPERYGIPVTFASWAYHIINHDTEPLLIQLGIRETIKSKLEWEKTKNLSQFWASEIKEEGTEKICNAIFELIIKNEIEELYLSFDVDVLNYDEMKATGTPSHNGLTLEEIMRILFFFKEKGLKITGADITEFAPLLDSTFESHKTVKPIFENLIRLL